MEKSRKQVQALDASIDKVGGAYFSAELELEDRIMCRVVIYYTYRQKVFSVESKRIWRRYKFMSLWSLYLFKYSYNIIFAQLGSKDCDQLSLLAVGRRKSSAAGQLEYRNS